MGRRLTSKKLRAALWRKSQGLCSICKSKLPPNWHADHVVPYCKTKKTNVHEMQALCPECNLRKGSKMRDELRTHQFEMEAISQKIALVRKKFSVLAHVVCGGGKSWLPGIMLRNMPSHVRLCWMVPRLALQSQAVASMRDDFGIKLRDASGSDIDPSRDRRGVVITHQSASQNIELWKDEFKRHKYILVVDEPHHAKVFKNGEKNALATFLDEVISDVAGVVYMTGTLTTGDNSKIYGVDYREAACGKLTPTYTGFDYVIRYKREKALEEKAIVPIEFFHHDGPVKWECMKTGEVSEIMLSEASRDDESNAIYTALQTEIAESLFDRGYNHWKIKGNKLLVVCDNQNNAKRWHDHLTSLGEKSFLAISDNEFAQDDISKFKSTPRSCLVTCAMAYEGLDEKPLSHVVCLTNIRSVPWIEQMLARVWRADKGKSVCFAFVTDDPRMQRVIQKIKLEEPDLLSTKTGTGGDGPNDRDVMPIQSLHELTRLSGLDSQTVFETLTVKQQEAFEYLISLGIASDDENFRAIINKLGEDRCEGLKRELTDSEREEQLRRSIKKYANQIDKEVFREEWGSAYKMLFKVNKKAINECNLSELQRSLVHVQQYLTRRTS